MGRHQLDRGGGDHRQSRRKLFQAAHFFLTSLQTIPQGFLQLVRDRWSNRFVEARSYESWHWIRDTQLHEDAHSYLGNGACAMDLLRTVAPQPVAA